MGPIRQPDDSGIAEPSLLNRVSVNIASTFDPVAVACITVTFNPDLSLLRTQLVGLPAGSLKVVVDNASKADILERIEELIAEIPHTRLLRNECNLGLAGAVNRGVRTAHEIDPAVRFTLLLDQDSEPRAGSIAALVNGFMALEAQGERVGCVGPVLIDATTGLQHGFHQCTRWRWRRIYPEDDSTQPVPCANLNGSGTLVPIDLFLQLGGLEEALFIDHVDTEWAFRVRAAGYGLFGIPQAIFVHRMGDDCRRIWLFGWRVWPMRSPQRHYYLFRNAAILMRRDYVPRVWKVWAVAKLLLTAGVHALSDPQRIAQLRCMLSGYRDSWVR